jgi:hypothetical protein
MAFCSTATVTCAVDEHPAEVPVTVYVVPETGLAVTLAPVELLNVNDGFHEKTDAPDAWSMALCPLQIIIDGVTWTTGEGFTFNVTCAEAEQPADVPVTVYVVFEFGLAVTLAPREVFRDAAGLHEYAEAPDAVSVALCPSQISGTGAAVTTGRGVTFTVICAVDEHPAEVPVTI